MGDRRHHASESFALKWNRAAGRRYEEVGGYGLFQHICILIGTIQSREKNMMKQEQK